MHILVVDDEREHRQYLADLVESWNYTVSTASDGPNAITAALNHPPDVLLTDLRMPRMDGIELLEKLREENLYPPAIVMTGFGSMELALQTVHEHGAFWFVEKPVQPENLKMLLTRAGQQNRLAIENTELRRQLSFQGVLGEMVGNSPIMREIFGVIRQVAPSNASVLITGESGTGKELVARAIHSNSKRSDKPFIALNCAAMPESLMESELFGHEKGSFTGAFERRIGSLEQAEGGTLFLDELGEMPMTMQAKLLRVLEDFTFRRIGGKQELKANVRIVAATNRDPMISIKENKLREDVFYRLNVFRIHLPPLRERISDLPLIVESIIHLLNKKHGTRITEAVPQTLQILSSRQWDGNVRELRNILERAAILASEGPLLPGHLTFGLNAEKANSQATSDSMSAGVLQEKDTHSGIQAGMTISEAEKLLIQATLEMTNNNKTKAAGILGISAKTLHSKLNQYRSDTPDSPVEIHPYDK